MNCFKRGLKIILQKRQFLIIFSLIFLFSSETYADENNENFAAKGEIEIEGEIGVSYQSEEMGSSDFFSFKSDFFPIVHYYFLNNSHIGISPGFGYERFKDNYYPEMKYTRYNFNPSLIIGYTIPLYEKSLFFDISARYIYCYSYMDTDCGNYKINYNVYGFTPKLKLMISEGGLLNFGLGYTYTDSDIVDLKHSVSFRIGVSIFL